MIFRVSPSSSFRLRSVFPVVSVFHMCFSVVFMCFRVFLFVPFGSGEQTSISVFSLLSSDRFFRSVFFQSVSVCFPLFPFFSFWFVQLFCFSCILVFRWGRVPKKRIMFCPFSQISFSSLFRFVLPALCFLLCIYRCYLTKCTSRFVFFDLYFPSCISCFVFSDLYSANCIFQFVFLRIEFVRLVFSELCFSICVCAECFRVLTPLYVLQVGFFQFENGM